jgi:hypothetical protein
LCLNPALWYVNVWMSLVLLYINQNVKMSKSYFLFFFVILFCMQIKTSKWQNRTFFFYCFFFFLVWIKTSKCQNRTFLFFLKLCLYIINQNVKMSKSYFSFFLETLYIINQNVKTSKSYFSFFSSYYFFVYKSKFQNRTFFFSPYYFFVYESKCQNCTFLLLCTYTLFLFLIMGEYVKRFKRNNIKYESKCQNRIFSSFAVLCFCYMNQNGKMSKSFLYFHFFYNFFFSLSNCKTQNFRSNIFEK